MKAPLTRSAQALDELTAAPPAEQRRRLCALFEQLSVDGRESVLTMAVCCADTDAERGRAAGPSTAEATGPRIVRFPVNRSVATSGNATVVRQLATRRRPKQNRQRQPGTETSARASAALGNKLQILALTNPSALRIVEQMADDLLRAPAHGPRTAG